MISVFATQSALWLLLALIAGWLLDRMLGDPAWLPHPVVGFGRMIAWGERRLNKGRGRTWKGAFLAVGLIVGVFAITAALLWVSTPVVRALIATFIIFCCLAGTTLIREVEAVFLATERSVEEGRRQVARIVGRDTTRLSAQEVRTAALETLAENLSDGVIAPLFWLLLLGPAGMLTYKMVNTLDSMIGYRTMRYRAFGKIAARIDDGFNYLPARLTALLMTGFNTRHLQFVARFGRCHASPNSGYPEAALAAILDCRFGGPHDYFGERFDKPFIGTNDRPLSTADLHQAVRVNRRAESVMVALTLLTILGIYLFL